MATDEERDGDRTKITLAAHGGLINVEIAPGLGRRVVLSADDGEVALGLLLSVEEQETVIDAIRRAQGREQGPTVPRAGVLPTGTIPPEAIELAVLMADIPGPKLARIAELQRALNVPRAAIEALRDTILGWEKAGDRGYYEDGRAAAILDCVAVIDTMLGTKDPGHADD